MGRCKKGVLCSKVIRFVNVDGVVRAGKSKEKLHQEKE